MDFKLNTRNNFMGQPQRINTPSFNFSDLHKGWTDTIAKGLQNAGKDIDDYLLKEDQRDYDKKVKEEQRDYDEKMRQKRIKEREEWLKKILGKKTDAELNNELNTLEGEKNDLSDRYNDDGTLKISKYSPLDSYKPEELTIKEKLAKIPGGEIMDEDTFRYKDADYSIDNIENGNPIQYEFSEFLY